MSSSKKEHDPCIEAQPGTQHKWLQQLVGQWTYESQATLGPDKPAEKSKGTETVRSLGGIWVIGEIEGEMHGGKVQMVITLGFDPAKDRFVGTFIGSMMTHMWIYNGELDDTGRKLTLSAEGPDMSPGATPGKMGQYRDIIEIVNNDQRILRSLAQGDDGSWVEFMQMHYRRA